VTQHATTRTRRRSQAASLELAASLWRMALSGGAALAMGLCGAEALARLPAAPDAARQLQALLKLNAP